MKKFKKVYLDFIIESKPLTDVERKAISEFIRNDKAKHQANKKSNTGRQKVHA